MEERRLYNRFDPAIEIEGSFELKAELTGGFRNFERFAVKDISVGGFNLLSSFSPTIHEKYSIFLNYRGEEHEFQVRIAFTRIHTFLADAKGFFKPGPLYSIGCEIEYSSEKQREMVIQIIRNDCVFPKKPETAPEE